MLHPSPIVWEAEPWKGRTLELFGAGYTLDKVNIPGLVFGILLPLRAASSYIIVAFNYLLGLLDCGALRQPWAGSMPDDGAKVPAWNGDPSSFEQFVQDCKWYESSLKPSERNWQLREYGGV